MSTQVITDTLQREARELLSHPGPLEFQALEEGHARAFSPEVEALLRNVLISVSKGSALKIERLPEELTTVQAADILGVSRPTLIKWIKEERLQAHWVGSHRRLKVADVLHFRAELNNRRAKSFDELRALEARVELAE